MKRNILFLVIGLLFCSVSNGQTFKQDFSAALRAKDMVKAEKILNAWDFADANDPELYTSYFNFFTIKSLEKDSTALDKEYSNKALEFISEGIERYPTRFDMRIAKIYMLGRLKDFIPFTNEVINLINYSKKIENNWKGENFSLINEAHEVFYGSVMEFQEILFAEKKTSLYNNINQISNEMVRNYPNHVQSWLNISTIYAIQKEYDKSIETLLKAINIEPKNAVLLFNIALVYGSKGDNSNSKKYLELTIANTTDKEEKIKEAAQKQLDAMK